MLNMWQNTKAMQYAPIMSDSLINFQFLCDLQYSWSSCDNKYSKHKKNNCFSYHSFLRPPIIMVVGVVVVVVLEAHLIVLCTCAHTK